MKLPFFSSSNAPAVTAIHDALFTSNKSLSKLGFDVYDDLKRVVTGTETSRGSLIDYESWKGAQDGLALLDDAVERLIAGNFDEAAVIATARDTARAAIGRLGQIRYAAPAEQAAGLRSVLDDLHSSTSTLQKFVSSDTSLWLPTGPKAVIENSLKTARSNLGTFEAFELKELARSGQSIPGSQESLLVDVARVNLAYAQMHVAPTSTAKYMIDASIEVTESLQRLLGASQVRHGNEYIVRNTANLANRSVGQILWDRPWTWLDAVADTATATY